MTKKKDKSLNELATEWNKKLKKSGFNDIEVGGISFKKRKYQPWFNNELTRAENFKNDLSKIDRFAVIGVYAHNCKTLNPLFAKVLQHYANGLSIPASIKKVGIYSMGGKVYTKETLCTYIKQFLADNLLQMVEFYNKLNEEDLENEQRFNYH